MTSMVSKLLPGYVDIGNINNELLKFEQSCKDEDGETPGSPLPVAKHMLVFMVRGVFIDLKFPFAQFATQTVTSDQLFPLAWEAVQKLEAADFKVIAFNLCVMGPHKTENSSVCTQTIRLKLYTKQVIHMRVNPGRYTSFQMLHI